MDRRFFFLARVIISKKQTTKNQVAWSAPPPTADTTKLSSMVGQTDFATPIRNAFARAKTDYANSYKNPLGAYTTADVRDKSIRSTNLALDQQEGNAMANASMQNQQNAFGQQSTVAQLTQPRMYNSVSATKQSDPFGTAMQIANLGLSAVSGGKAGI